MTNRALESVFSRRRVASRAFVTQQLADVVRDRLMRNRTPETIGGLMDLGRYHDDVGMARWDLELVAPTLVHVLREREVLRPAHHSRNAKYFRLNRQALDMWGVAEALAAEPS